MAHIIVLGNEKGGSGKSTIAMHIATALVRMGYTVGTLDLDLRQRSFHRYIENRQATIAAKGMNAACPLPMELPRIAPGDLEPDDNVRDRQLLAVLDDMKGCCDFIVIDCPGSHTRLSHAGHSLADTLITPMNDSFVDFDLLARIEPKTYEIQRPSIYSEMVWQARQMRAEAGLNAIDWIVVRNRVGAQQMHNKRKVGGALDRLAKRIGFRVGTGFSERVIFRELFPAGMTLLDLRELGVERLNISNLSARQELRDLLAGLNLPEVEVNF
ncbi:MAG: P-loop NTPase [Rhodobacteraceae bacterium]|nr:P-loop NTPase [Paracoccaceae bacterium]